jgi:hypothetical protein
MVCLLPSGVHNRSFAYLDDAVASSESDPKGSPKQLNVSPLIPMPVNVVSDFAEKNAIRL